MALAAKRHFFHRVFFFTCVTHLINCFWYCFILVDGTTAVVGNLVIDTSVAVTLAFCPLFLLAFKTDGTGSGNFTVSCNVRKLV